MAEANMSGRLACDLCHARKVKCDKKEPCENCVHAKAQCLRTRHSRRNRASRTRSEQKLQDLRKRLSRLEESLGITDRPANNQPLSNCALERDPIEERSPDVVRELQASISPVSTAGQGFEQAEIQQHPNRRNPGETELGDGGPLHDSSYNGSAPQMNDARDVIQQELNRHPVLRNDRITILRKALSFIKEVSLSNHESEETVNFENAKAISQPPTEVIYMALRSELNREGFYNLGFPDHIPPSAVERAAQALLDNSASEQESLQYTIVIYYKAVLSLSDWPIESRNRFLDPHLTMSRKQFIEIALTALGDISLLSVPSLSLLQALLSGAALMQMIGDISKCWSLAASASNVIATLGYQKVAETAPRSTIDQEIHVAVAWCYQFDKSTSMLLLRPQTLPKLRVRAAALIRTENSSPMSEFVRLMMELAEAQEVILDISVEVDKQGDKMHGRTNRARSNIARCGTRIQELLRLPQNRGTAVHWLMLQFMYHSILTAAMRLGFNLVSDSSPREECIEHARNSLFSLKRIQTCFTEEGNIGMDHFYFFWTISSYPLSPFIVIFCNIVCTSSLQDFHLLQAVSDGIAGLADADQRVSKFHKLFDKFVNLCQPLVGEFASDWSEHPMGRGPTLPSAANTGNVSMRPSGFLPNQRFDMSAYPPGDECNMLGWETAPNLASAASAVPSLWDDELMGQLFEVQPHAGWFSSSVFHNY